MLAHIHLHISVHSARVLVLFVCCWLCAVVLSILSGSKSLPILVVEEVRAKNTNDKNKKVSAVNFHTHAIAHPSRLGPGIVLTCPHFKVRAGGCRVAGPMLVICVLARVYLGGHTRFSQVVITGGHFVVMVGGEGVPSPVSSQCDQTRPWLQSGTALAAALPSPAALKTLDF